SGHDVRDVGQRPPLGDRFRGKRAGAALLRDLRRRAQPPAVDLPPALRRRRPPRRDARDHRRHPREIARDAAAGYVHRVPWPLGVELRLRRVALGDERAGEVVAERYRLIARIGRGGMGTIYEAAHVVTGKKLAVKMLLPGFGRVPEIAKRFEREARAASLLAHPNIVSVMDFGTHTDGALFL